MPWLLYGLIALVVILAIWVTHLEMRLKRLLAGKNAATLEDTIVRLREEVTKLFEHRIALEARLGEVDSRVRRSVQWVETKRFNPFPDQGGNQSFSMLLSNEHGDGVLLTGLYARDKSSVYAKPVGKYESEYELSGEEAELIKRVRG